MYILHIYTTYTMYECISYSYLKSPSIFSRLKITDAIEPMRNLLTIVESTK